MKDLNILTNIQEHMDLELIGAIIRSMVEKSNYVHMFKFKFKFKFTLFNTFIKNIQRKTNI